MHFLRILHDPFDPCGIPLNTKNQCPHSNKSPSVHRHMIIRHTDLCDKKYWPIPRGWDWIYLFIHQCMFSSNVSLFPAYNKRKLGSDVGQPGILITGDNRVSHTHPSVVSPVRIPSCSTSKPGFPLMPLLSEILDRPFTLLELHRLSLSIH